MEMGHEALGGCYKFNDFVGQQVGLDRRNPEPGNLFLAVELLQ
jgi:hypothetical protein